MGAPNAVVVLKYQEVGQLRYVVQHLAGIDILERQQPQRIEVVTEGSVGPVVQIVAEVHERRGQRIVARPGHVARRIQVDGYLGRAVLHHQVLRGRGPQLGQGDVASRVGVGVAERQTQVSIEHVPAVAACDGADGEVQEAHFGVGRHGREVQVPGQLQRHREAQEKGLRGVRQPRQVNAEREAPREARG